MPDAMDRVQQLAADLNESALENHQRLHPQRPGLTRCERYNCGEPIGPQRTAQGARLCDECQEEDDKRKAHFAAWARAW